MKGTVREDAVIDALRPFIGARYGMVKGVVVNSAGEESDPQDIILWDTSVFPSFLGSASNKAIPVESVVGVIQVKSHANRKNVRDAIANVATAKRLLTDKRRFGHPISGADNPGHWSTGATFFGGVLFLHADGNGTNAAEEFGKVGSKAVPRERCDAMCVIDRVTVLWGNPSGGEALHFAVRAEEAEAPLALWTNHDALLFFYYSLLEHLRGWIIPPPDWLDYIFGPTRDAKGVALQYAYWESDESPPPP